MLMETTSNRKAEARGQVSAEQEPGIQWILIGFHTDDKTSLPEAQYSEITQFSICNAGTLINSLTLLVTIISPSLRA